MPLSVLALLIGGVIGVVVGGSLRHVSTWRVRTWWLLLPGVGLQLAADHWALGPEGTVVLVAGYLCLLVFAARNVLLVGMSVIIVGLASNLIVVATNGGMPVHPAAVTDAGIAAPNQLNDVAYGHRHHLETSADHLRFLDDRLPLGAFHQVLSIGDLILLVGIADLAANVIRRPRRERLAPLLAVAVGSAEPPPAGDETEADKSEETPGEAVVSDEAVVSNETAVSNGSGSPSGTRVKSSSKAGPFAAATTAIAVTTVVVAGSIRHRLRRFRRFVQPVEDIDGTDFTPGLPPEYSSAPFAADPGPTDLVGPTEPEAAPAQVTAQVATPEPEAAAPEDVDLVVTETSAPEPEAAAADRTPGPEPGEPEGAGLEAPAPESSRSNDAEPGPALTAETDDADADDAVAGPSRVTILAAAVVDASRNRLTRLRRGIQPVVDVPETGAPEGLPDGYSSAAVVLDSDVGDPQRSIAHQAAGPGGESDDAGSDRVAGRAEPDGLGVFDQEVATVWSAAEVADVDAGGRFGRRRLAALVGVGHRQSQEPPPQ